MGVIGQTVGSYGGAALGEFLAKKVGGVKYADAGKNIGRVVGSEVGSALVPFKMGGRVKKTGPALVHRGELIIPAKYAKEVSKSLKTKIKKNGGRNM